MVELQDFYADPRVTEVQPALPPFVIWITAVLIYFVATYPFQPVIFLWLGPWPQISYGLLCLLGIAVLCAYPKQGFIVQYRRPTIFVVGLLASTMLVTLTLYQNPTVVRDLLLLTLVVLLMFKARGTATLRIIRALIYICVAALVPAMLIVALFNAHVIDWPSWNVDRLGLLPGNPLLNRQNYGDQDFFLPYWLSVVPQIPIADQGFGLHFTRQPLIYIEPTDTWYYTAGLLWLAVADTKMPARRFCIAVMTIALAVSFSVAGVLATIAATVLCAAMTLGGRKLVFLFIVAGLLVFASVPVERLIALVGSNKADEFHYYQDTVTVFNNLTLFGNPASDDQPQSYGALVVLYRYGIVGSGVFLVVVGALTLASFGLLRDRAILGWRRFPLFMSCFISLVVLSKYPGIVPSIPALCLAGALSFRHIEMDPFSLVLLR
jgi:hypothetical protein